MKLIAVAVVLLFVGVTLAADKYTIKLDGKNLDEILKTDRLFSSYFKCLMDQGRCTPDGNELKRTLPDALTNSCSKCSEKQKAGAEQFVNFLIKNKTKQWGDLQKKYDPEGIYAKQQQAAANAHRI